MYVANYFMLSICRGLDCVLVVGVLVVGVLVMVVFVVGILVVGLYL